MGRWRGAATQTVSRTSVPVSKPSGAFQPKASNASLMLYLLPPPLDNSPHSSSQQLLPVPSPGSAVVSIFGHQKRKQKLKFVLSQINPITLLCSTGIINLISSE